MLQSTPPAQDFLENTTLKDLLGIPEAALDQVMATAYQLYQGGYYDQVATLCRGLIAADHKYWWSYSLYAAVLRRLGRLHEAVEQLDIALTFEPGEPQLLLMRGEILAAIGRWVPARTPAAAAAPSPSPSR